MLDEDLNSLYLAAIYEIDFPNGVVRFRIGDSVRGKPFALVTAFNPGRSRPAPEDNKRANGRLEAAIRGRGYEFAPARGRSQDGTHAEPSFAVFGMPFEAAWQLAKEFGQAAFVWSDGETTKLTWTDERGDARPT